MENSRSNRLAWCLEQLSPPGYEAALSAARVIVAALDKTDKERNSVAAVAASPSAPLVSF